MRLENARLICSKLYCCSIWPMLLFQFWQMYRYISLSPKAQFSSCNISKVTVNFKMPPIFFLNIGINRFFKNNPSFP